MTISEDEVLKLAYSLSMLNGIAVDYWSKELCLNGSPIAKLTGDTPVIANAIVDVVKGANMLLDEIRTRKLCSSVAAKGNEGA